MLSFGNTKRIFKDISLQQEFERNGFVVVDFYSISDLGEVSALYGKLHGENEAGFFPSTYSSDKDYRHTVDSELKRIGDKRFGELFIDIQIINGCFIVKSPGESSYLHIHQDMTLVDETEFTGINIWTTTIDLTDKNGALYALPGSHRFYPTYRGHTIPGFYDPIQEEIKDYMMPFYLKAGQAVVFDQSIVHFSPPNLSDGLRIVTNVFITHRDARFVTCYHDKNNPEAVGKVELFEQEKGFMTDNEQFGKNIYERPQIGNSLGLFDYDFPQLTIDDLENKFGKKKLREYTPTKKIEASDSAGENNLPEIKPSFWQIYTPTNIIKEIKFRLTGN
jgi:ectoine hydroxylase-related dioxygenase (phytanoyl-CoA dioxygenase family)